MTATPTSQPPSTTTVGPTDTRRVGFGTVRGVRISDVLALGATVTFGYLALRGTSQSARVVSEVSGSFADITREIVKAMQPAPWTLRSVPIGCEEWEIVQMRRLFATLRRAFREAEQCE